MPLKISCLTLLMLAGLCIFPVHATEEEPPPMELLEFLAEFETEDGEWIDPMELENMDITGQEQTKDAY